MKLRYYAAIVTGALAEVLTVAVLWMHTGLPIHEIAFLAVPSYFAGIMSVLAVTQKKKKAIKLGPPPIITLDKEEWNKKAG